MRSFIVLFFVIMSLTGFSQSSFYDFVVKDINGNDFAFSQLAGKKVMVVNTASKCGFTPQYEGLEKLYKEFGGEDFVIIGFPANNFLYQEPGSDEAIKEFCTLNYGVTFPMMSKISVKGNKKHDLYKWLTQKDLNGVQDSKVSWNFQKYLIGKDGKLEKVISPKTKPYNSEIVDWIKQ
ncbi:MAG: glutathione peroxidase [Bacteroidales bacterium]|jgi:glutathione peroxidase|nr:glutathione peroxidase [Bacteroidales bacterium]